MTEKRGFGIGRDFFPVNIQPVFLFTRLGKKKSRSENPEKAFVKPSVIPSSFRHFPDFQFVAFDGRRILPATVHQPE